jgi:hypothetical protein
MPNPNYSGLRLDIQYGPDADNLQSTRIDVVAEQQVDAAENIYAINVDNALGFYIELVDYSVIHMVTVQNTHAANIGWIDYVDELTAQNPIYEIGPGEFTIINRPSRTNGILLYADPAEPLVDFHICIHGVHNT